jgi:small subunit ribosomal protein S21
MTDASQNEFHNPHATYPTPPQGPSGYRGDRGGDLRPMEVRVDGDNINRAINQLKRKMANEGIYKELKKRRFYEKPCEQRKRKQREAERRLRKAQRRSV